MIKLADILKEALSEANTVQVPEEILSKLEGIYDYIKKNKDKLDNSAPKDFLRPFIPSQYSKYLKFNDLSGKPMEVSIGFYNDPDDDGGGMYDPRTDTMIINLAFFGDKEYFLDTGEHELVHAMDPKVTNVKIYGKMLPKKYGTPTVNADRYYKSPWEFDAMTATLINKLKSNLDKNKEGKAKYLQNLVQMFSELRTKSIEDVSKDEKYRSLAYFFSKKDWNDESKWANIFAEFTYELNRIKNWITKPTLYKKFLQRLYTSVK